jgi:hypothetical protein
MVCKNDYNCKLSYPYVAKKILLSTIAILHYVMVTAQVLHLYGDTQKHPHTI